MSGMWSWGKVIFSQVSVILLIGGVWRLVPGGASSWGGVSGPGGSLLGGSAPGGCLLQGVCSGGVPGGDPRGTATAAGGMHSTGMHSCTNNEFGYNEHPATMSK